MKSLFFVIAIIFSVSAFAANGGDINGAGCTNNCGNSGGSGGAGGSGGNGGPSTAFSGSVSGAAAISDSTSSASTASASTASSNGGVATNGPVSNSVTTGNVRSLSLGAAAVGSPANGTCAGYLAVGFGLITFPVTLESCQALQEAVILDQFGARRSAIQRLCQLKEISVTDVCADVIPKKEPVTQQTE